MAMILDAFVGRYINKLSEFIEGEISMLLGVKDELEDLRSTMERISCFLESAEHKRHADRDIDIWVEKLKDVMYDADDIIDLCTIEGRKLLEDDPSKSAVRRPSSLFSCFGCIKFRHEIGSKIRELNDKLKKIGENRSKLPQLEYIKPDVHESGVNPRQTSPIKNKSDIIGTQIRKDIQHLVESLIKEDNEKCQVLGIVGMGGIGKTTLARHIYNDERIKENFPKRIWACVSQNFSEIELLKQLIRGAGGNYGEANTKAELSPCLSSALVKRFLIVLDDVWTTEVWTDLLRDPLENATADRRVVVTTRHIEVATVMRAYVYYVNKMDIDSGWEMLRKKVFTDDDDDDEAEISNLKVIGAKIIEKCNGLPLAIKTIAGVLELREKNALEWNKILQSDAWSMSQLQEELPAALFLSYQDLPSHLKQCFLYCSLFPGGICRDDLIHYWVAEGFIKEKQGEIIMEDLAEDYYRDLIRRNLLQLDEDTIDDRWCSLHDLLRSLALFLTKGEGVFLDEGQPLNINPSIKLHRLSMTNMGEEVKILNVIKQQKYLRTLMLRRNPKMIENEFLERLRLLRVVTINDTQLESLPDSVGNLLHLRYLDLDRTNIRELPESIGCLINLQILNLAHCNFLRTLPKAITKLCNLRCLRLKGTPLAHMPKGIGKLKHLNSLEGFVVGYDGRGAQDEEGCDLEEIHSLSQLRLLHIERLERAHVGATLRLADNHFLKTLILMCEQDNQEERTSQEIDRIYDELSPPSTLQRLEMNNFLGTRFPCWMMSPSLGVSFPYLVYIRLSGCKLCSQLPPFGLLPQLKILRISGADAITIIGSEFLCHYTSSMVTAFPKLEELYFFSMNNWEEWSFEIVAEVGGEETRGPPKLLPHLRFLHLSGCHKLTALPAALRYATSLLELQIDDADSLTEINNLSCSIKRLHLFNCPMLERVSNLPSLEILVVWDCPRLQHVENLQHLERVVYLADQPSEASTPRLPEWLLGLREQHRNAPFALRIEESPKFDDLLR